MRLYHRMGLLVPSHINPTNGFRSYSVHQIADGGIICELRHLDVPLDPIA